MTAVKNKPLNSSQGNLRIEDNMGLVHMQAKVGERMGQINGVHLEYQDWVQEACIAYLKAVEGYDPATGFKFSAYFTKAAFSHFRKVIGRMTGVKSLNGNQRDEIAERNEENNRRRAAGEADLPNIQYGIRPMNFGDLRLFRDEEDQAPFEEALPSDMLSPEQQLEMAQEVDDAVAKLSPLAQLVVEWLRDPPPELIREVNATAAHADLCTEQGITAAKNSRKGLTIDAIGSFLQVAGVPKVATQMSTVKRELDELSARLNGELELERLVDRLLKVIQPKEASHG